MFEARLNQGSLFKKLVDAIKDLVSEVNFDCGSSGITIQVYFYLFRQWILHMSH